MINLRNKSVIRFLGTSNEFVIQQEKKEEKKKILNATSRASLVSEKKNLERVSNFLANCNMLVYLLFTRIGRYMLEELLERQPVRCFARKIRSGIYELNARHDLMANRLKWSMLGNLFAPHVALRGRRSGSVWARDPGTSTNLLSFPSLPPPFL